MAEKIDWLVPLPAPRDQISDARQFRSTWLTASQAALRDRGLIAKYEARLEPSRKQEILSAVPGMWLSMEIARAHYLACDALGLPAEELLAIGMAATRRANATTLAFVARLAQGTGVTPWTVLAHATRLWQHTCDGGAIGIARHGPKEARIDIIGFPLAAIPYCRITMRGIALAVIELFCRKAYAREAPGLADARSIVMRVSWA